MARCLCCPNDGEPPTAPLGKPRCRGGTRGRGLQRKPVQEDRSSSRGGPLFRHTCHRIALGGITPNSDFAAATGIRFEAIAVHLPFAPIATMVAGKAARSSEPRQRAPE